MKMKIKTKSYVLCSIMEYLHKTISLPAVFNNETIVQFSIEIRVRKSFSLKNKI